jgi:hypothetical protein
MAAQVGHEEYRRLLNGHGRRVANRALVESLPREDRDWPLFYECYGPEAALPENERARTEIARGYDPIGYSRFYDNHPCDHTSPIYRATNGLSVTLFDQLIGAVGCWGEWIASFLHEMFHEVPNETTSSIADDEGEHYTEDGCRFCNWVPGWRGWRDWGASLSTDEERAWKLILAPKAYRFRHPEPGSPEAEARYPSKKEGKEN